MTAALTPAQEGRALADREVHDAVCRLLDQQAVSERANAPHAARIEPEWADTLAAKRRRLEQIRDGLEKGRGR